MSDVGLAHRVSYKEYVGDPGTQIVMHKCDTPACVNPDHLVLGSHRENAVDATRKLRTKFSRASIEQRRAWAGHATVSGLKASVGLSLRERVDRMSVPEPNTGCHLWMGPVNDAGYGKIKVDGRMHRAHRVSYAANVSTIPTGMMVLHKCDTPACVNPDHLFLGDARDNILDATRKGRTAWVRATAEQRAEWTRKRLLNEAASGLSRSDVVRDGWETRRENGREFTLTPEQSSERSKKAWITRFEQYGSLGVSREWDRSGAAKKGWADLTPEEHAARAQLLAEARRRAKEVHLLAKPPRCSSTSSPRGPREGLRQQGPDNVVHLQTDPRGIGAGSARACSRVAGRSSAPARTRSSGSSRATRTRRTSAPASSSPRRRAPPSATRATYSCSRARASSPVSAVSGSSVSASTWN